MGSIGANQNRGGEATSNSTQLTPAQAMQMYNDTFEYGGTVSNEVIQTVNRAVDSAKWSGDKYLSELNVEGVGRATVRLPKDPDDNDYVVNVYSADGYQIDGDRITKLSDAKKYAKDALKIK